MVCLFSMQKIECLKASLDMLVDLRKSQPKIIMSFNERMCSFEWQKNTEFPLKHKRNATSIIWLFCEMLEKENFLYATTAIAIIIIQTRKEQ